jgi:tetratricopeptide (TPR) repeat protein
MKNIFLNKKLFIALCVLCFAVGILSADAKEAELSAAVNTAKNKKQLLLAYEGSGQYYFSVADYPKALSAYNQALELKPSKRSRYEIYIKIGAILTEMRSFEDALEYYRNAESLYPSKTRAKLEMGKFYLKTGLFYLAEIKFLEVLSIDEADRAANRYLGDIYFAQKLYEKALRYYEASEPSYTNKKLMLNMASAYRNVDKKDEAIKLLTGCLNALGNDEDILLALALIYIQKNEEKTAINYLLEVIDINPESLDANIYLAQIYLDAGKLEEASTVVKRAAELAPDLASVNILQSKLYFMQGHYAQAKTQAHLAQEKSKTPFVKTSARRLTKFLNENY